MSTGTPLWLDERYTPRAPLEGEVAVEVCVVGAGIGGLATAWHLAERGAAPLVLDAATVGGGASGRNGGFFLAGAAEFQNDLRRRVGAERARALYAATLEAQQAVYALADDIGAASCFRRAGGLRLAYDAGEAGHVREMAQCLEEDGFPGWLVEEDDLPAPLRRPGRVGHVTPGDAAMHPARWVRALGAAVERAGTTIHERTRVVAPVIPGPAGGFTLDTPRGRVRAERVVVACDAALPSLVPEFRDRVRSRRLHMVATAPLPPVLPEQTIYTRYGLEYLQQTDEGRVAVGGFGDLDGDASYTEREVADPDIHDRLERYLREEYGIDAPVTHRWIGLVGYSVDGLPFVGRTRTHDDLYALGGYSGTGNCNGFLAGRIVAELVADGRSPLAHVYDARRDAVEARPLV